MDLTKLFELANEMPGFCALISRIMAGEKESLISVLEGAKPYLLAALYREARRPLFIVTETPGAGKRLYEQLLSWDGGINVYLFPESDTLPYQRLLPDTSAQTERIRILSMLLNIGNNNPVIISSVSALMQKLTPKDEFVRANFIVKRDTDIPLLGLLSRLQKAGYRREDTVSLPGDVSHRGGIVDMFPPSLEAPVRIEFFGNTIESIRLFDPETQRSLKELETVTISPARELFAPLVMEEKELKKVLKKLDISGLNDGAKVQYEQEFSQILQHEDGELFDFYTPLFNDGRLTDYLPEETLIVLDEPEKLKNAATAYNAASDESRGEKILRGELPADFPRPYFKWEEIGQALEGKTHLSFVAWGIFPNGKVHEFSLVPAQSFGGQIPLFVQKIRQLLRQKNRIIIVTQQAGRLSEMLEDVDIIAPVLSEMKELPPPGGLMLLQGSLASGWIANERTYLFTDTEIFGFVKEHRLAKRRIFTRKRHLTDFEPGNYVVHIEHGIAQFTGVALMTSDNTEKEYLVLQYASGDKLFVPGDQIDRVSRYVGAGDAAPVLNRLGTQEWNRTRQKAKEAAQAVAQELLDLYASREVVPGFVFSPDKPWQQELEASFPYVETRDQLAAIRQVKEDLEKPKPMDRLVLGDVGYGKTEVAIRAAFKAIMDGKQVAVLVPTTVLAEQHFITFSQRMEAFPVKIAVLSRFHSAREQREVVDGLKKGKVDIVIGTHRILQKDIEFKDLGLVIIDEEQRFGVAHKEYLKEMKRNVAVLTLSATPIPRTLHMSLVGVRDISQIETPPEDRLPVKSYVAQYDEHLIREAILRELERKGQVFFVHNRVQDIASVALKLKMLVPEARVSVGHGQMDEEELEKVMDDFARRKSDILVCTTIIESGLDMPNVNTLIVDHADKLGLTQLYQLRGRVGRGTELAYAYFLFHKDKKLTETAEKRLRTILEAAELGAGFNIAMRDLEIRGAGTLLGTKQSGFISAVGFDLYTRLLAEAIEEMKAKQSGKQLDEIHSRRMPPLNIDLPIKALLPEDYIPDLETRLDLYQRLADMTKLEEVDDMAIELLDRFGTRPGAVNNLLYALKIRILAGRTGIERIQSEPGYIVLKLFEGMEFDRRKLEPFLKYGIRIGVNQLRINSRRRLGDEWRGVLEEVLTMMSKEQVAVS
jgi:transcription-repair coupling factor (superfamily II helicase)